MFIDVYLFILRSECFEFFKKSRQELSNFVNTDERKESEFSSLKKIQNHNRTAVALSFFIFLKFRTGIFSTFSHTSKHSLKSRIVDSNQKRCGSIKICLLATFFTIFQQVGVGRRILAPLPPPRTVL